MQINSLALNFITNTPQPHPSAGECRSPPLGGDNFGASFAGKYSSYFYPNQGTPKENLHDLTLSIRRTYSSIYSPDALMYRRRMVNLSHPQLRPHLKKIPRNGRAHLVQKDNRHEGIETDPGCTASRRDQIGILKEK